MTALERLMVMVEAMPEGSSVTLPREALLAALGKTAANQAEASKSSEADLTIQDLARRFQRSVSTVRGWVEHGRFPGAYKLENREWRVPSKAVVTFIGQQQTVQSTVITPRSSLGTLSDWRRVGGAKSDEPK